MARILCFVGRLILSLRYRVRITGIQDVANRKSGGILMLANHPALIDPIILMGYLHPHFGQRALADEDQASRPVIRNMAAAVRVIKLPDAVRRGAESLAGVAQALDECAECLKRGDNVLIYPAGHILRGRYEDIGGNSGVETILRKAPDARVVLVKTSGLWGSAYSRADGAYPDLRRLFKKAIVFLAGNLFFLGPRRVVDISLREASDFPRTAGRHAMNSYLESYYNADATPNTYVPYFFWERGGLRVLPEVAVSRTAFDPDSISSAVRELVERKLRDLAGVNDVSPARKISNDLGLDSLARLDLVIWLEQEFGFHVPNPDMFETVGDVLAAAAGESLADKVAAMPPAPAAWFKRPGRKQALGMLPPGETIHGVFLAKARATPQRPVLADGTSGVRTYRDIITAIYVLKPIVENVRGDYVGIMLPASSTAGILYLAALFAGKTPVMLNWTVGSRNLDFMRNLLGVEVIFTSRQLTAKLKGQGVSFGEVEPHFKYLESLKDEVSLLDKLKAKARSYLSTGGLEGDAGGDTAVVLFTSGSESVPKAVPLTHANLLTNIRDVITTQALMDSDAMLGFLPPFHSFGLTLTVILPLITGLRAYYHPNPTEGGTLAKLIKLYKVSILAGTPSFINGILKGAVPDDLSSLRLAVTGAEKCPEHVHRNLGEMCPGMIILEGYGITECSPVVAVNRPDKPVPYSIGRVMDSLEYVIVDEESGERCPAGRQGVLMVRGGSIFGGYIGYDGPSPFVEIAGKSYYRTGDLVVADDDGVLFFKGRLKRFVKLGGEMVSMPAIEDALLNTFQPEGADGPVLAVESPSEESPEVTLYTVNEISREQANQAIKDAGLSPIHNIRRVVKVDAIPLLGTGKTDYRTLKGVR